MRPDTKAAARLQERMHPCRCCLLHFSESPLQQTYKFQQASCRSLSVHKISAQADEAMPMQEEVSIINTTIFRRATYETES